MITLQRREMPTGEARLYADLGDLSLDPANAREHPDENVAGIASSLEEYGQQTPIVIGPTGYIAKGNGTFMGACRLGWDDIWVTPTDLSGFKLAGYSVADNRTGDTSKFDDLQLAKILEANRSQPAPAFTGFDDDQVDALLERLAAKAADDGEGEEEGDSDDVGEKYELVVECAGEADQRVLFERLQKEGYKCRVLTL